MPEQVDVIKLNLDRQETWRYTGQVLYRQADMLVIEAYFNRDDMPFHGVTFAKGDRFVEAYYTDRWYNIFEMYSRDDDHLKGWYCNISRPAEFQPGRIQYVDLALDLLVYPDGRQLVLDQDEFDALHLPAETQEQALAALQVLRGLFRRPDGFHLLK